jgi:hypothetical protein
LFRDIFVTNQNLFAQPSERGQVAFGQTGIFLTMKNAPLNQTSVLQKSAARCFFGRHAAWVCRALAAAALSLASLMPFQDAQGQTTFSGSYSFAGSIGATNSLAYNGTNIPNLNVGSLTKNGVTNSSSTGNFRASNFGTGSTDSGAAGGTLDPSKYFEFAITASPGFTLSDLTITFGVGRSGTGPRQFEWRSSLDSYATALVVTTNNAALTKTSNNVLQTPDANAGYTGNIVSLPTTGQSTVTFRLYIYGAESASGTGGLQGDLFFSGTLSGTAVPPPAPLILAPTSITTSGFTANWQASSGATKYYLDVATDSGFTSLVSGYSNLDVGNVISFAVTGLSPSTTYYYRVRAGNSTGTSGNSQSQAATTTSLTAPAIVVSPGSLTNFSYSGTGPSVAQSVSVTASNLTGAPGLLAVSGSANYEVSTTSSNSGFGSSATLAYSNTIISATDLWIRLKAGLGAGSYNGETVSVSGGGAASPATVSLGGSVTIPSISVATTNLGTFTGTNGVGSASKTLTVSGTGLTAPVSVAAPTNFQVGLDTNSYAASLSITNNGTLTNTPILVRVAPSAAVGVLATNNITVSSPGATNRLVQVAGSVVYGSIGMSINGTNAVVVNEGDPALTLDVALSQPAPAGGTTVTLTTTDNDNSEITLSPTSLVFAEGETAKTATVTPLADTVFDVDQTVVISAAAANWGTAGTVSVRVVNVDPAPPAYISLASTNTNAYVQTFNSLGTVTISNAFSATSGVQTSIGALVSTNLNGWFGAKLSGDGTSPIPLPADSGTLTSGAVYNYGSTNTNSSVNLDRSLGTLASGNAIMAFGALLKNETGTNINSVKVSMTGERWRCTTNANTLVFSFGRVDGGDVTDANFLTAAIASAVPGLDVTFPAATNNSAVDGNAATNQVAFSNVLVPVNLAPGETAFIRWRDANDAGNDAGISIDNLSMSASQDLPNPDGEGTAALSNGDSGSYLFNSRIWARGASNQIVAVTVTPTFDVSTVASVSIEVPLSWGTPTQVGTQLEGGASGGAVAVVGQTVTVSGASITKANPGIIRIGGLATPNDAAIGTGDGLYQFNVATAGAGGTLLPISKQPSANVIVPISNVRDVDANFLPVDAGKVVAVEGVVTWGFIGGVYFQDSTGGMNAASNIALAYPLTAGNKYAIVGILGSANGLIRITPASFSDVVDMGAGVAPSPAVVALPQTASAFEAIEGTLITISNLTRDAADTDPWGKPSTITAQDSSGNKIDIRISGDFEGFAIEPGFPVTVTGILSQFDTSNPRDTGYQIMPRRMSDMTFPPTLRLTWSINSATIDIREDGAGFDPSVTYLTLERIGNSVGAVQVELTATPSGRISNNGQPLPQVISLADGEVSKILGITPVNNSSTSPDTVITIGVSATGYTSASNSQLRILEDDSSGDITPPVITINGANPALVSWGAVYLDAGATAFDAGDNTNVTVLTSGSVDTGVPGSYSIIYSASDSRSNIATASRIVNVSMANNGTNVASNGLSDLINYAFGATSPNTPVSPALLPSNSISGGSFVMTYVARTNANVTVVPNVNTALTNSNGWTTNGVSVSTIGTVATNGTILDRRQATVPVQGAGKFLRLRVNMAP